MSQTHETPPTLVVAGPVTIDDVSAHRETWLAALAHGEGVRLELSDSGPWDVAGLQLLLAALATPDGPVMVANVPGVLRQLAERAGVLDRLQASSV